MCQSRPLFRLFSSFSHSTFKKAQMVCLGFEPVAANGRRRRNPRAMAAAQSCITLLYKPVFYACKYTESNIQFGIEHNVFVFIIRTKTCVQAKKLVQHSLTHSTSKSRNFSPFHSRGCSVTRLGYFKRFGGNFFVLKQLKSLKIFWGYFKNRTFSEKSLKNKSCRNWATFCSNIRSRCRGENARKKVTWSSSSSSSICVNLILESHSSRTWAATHITSKHKHKKETAQFFFEIMTGPFRKFRPCDATHKRVAHSHSPFHRAFLMFGAFQ